MARRRQRSADKLRAPDIAYGEGGDVLVLRAAMTPKTRVAYQEIGGVREDAWQRSVEFLFERLAVSWTIAGAEPLTKQGELLGRLRFATPEERAWIREQLRAHLAEHFPELAPP
jgi:hypothetical protein